MNTALVTGSSDGIGKEMARQLLRRDWRVLVHGRSEERARQAMQNLAKEGGELDLVYGDFARMKEVVEMAKQVEGKAPKLDVLLSNAGIFATRRESTEDGFEKTMAVNHFAAHLLTRLLLPKLQAAEQGRVVVVASMAHNGSLDLSDLNFEKHFSGYGAYSASKLANILFTKALAKRLQGSRITANCLHPGVINTKLLRQGFGAFGGGVEEGAETAVYLATEPSLTKISGEYFNNKRIAQPSAAARDAALAEKLWVESERLLKPFLAEAAPLEKAA